MTTLMGSGAAAAEAAVAVGVRSATVAVYSALALAVAVSAWRARRRALRGGEDAAGRWMGWAFLLVGVAYAPIAAFAAATLVLVPLLGFAVALPYLDGRGLRRFAAATFGAEVAIVTLGALPLYRLAVPRLVELGLGIGAVAATAALVIYLLVQYSSGLRAALATEADARRHAEEAVRGRDAFLSMAAHELRTPLTALQLQVEAALRAARGDGASDGAAAVAERLARASRSTTRLGFLVNTLLDLSRIAAGRLVLDRAPIDLAVLAREVAERELGGRDGTPLVVRAEQPVVGEWDGARLEQVVTNLVGNAMKYGRGAPVEVRVEVDGASGAARLVVEDHGIGIAPEAHARIFERFERAVPDRQYGGFGLGLWITREIVEAHGGTIAVASAPGQGATFTVVLPARGPAPGGPDGSARS